MLLETSDFNVLHCTQIIQQLNQFGTVLQQFYSKAAVETFFSFTIFLFDHKIQVEEEWRKSINYQRVQTVVPLKMKSNHFAFHLVKIVIAFWSHTGINNIYMFRVEIMKANSDLF